MLLHRLILDPPPDMQVDHANRDPLDNRRCNIRVCTPQENTRNFRERQGSKISYKGVSYNDKLDTYDAKIRIGEGQSTWIGSYELRENAARAYDAAARYYHGEFAYTNFKDGPAMSIEEIRAARPKILRKRTRRDRGVSEMKGRRGRKYRVLVTHNGKQHYGGVYETPEEAALAADRLRLKLGVSREYLNFPDKAEEV